MRVHIVSSAVPVGYIARYERLLGSQRERERETIRVSVTRDSHLKRQEVSGDC